MTKEDKEKIKNRQLTESILFACLITCEFVIGRNAYLEQKWCNNYTNRYGQSAGDEYGMERLEWMSYREKIRAVLQKRYQMKQIIQMTKSCTDKVTQKTVKDVVVLIDARDYVLV